MTETLRRHFPLGHFLPVLIGFAPLIVLDGCRDERVVPPKAQDDARVSSPCDSAIELAREAMKAREPHAVFANPESSPTPVTIQQFTAEHIRSPLLRKDLARLNPDERVCTVYSNGRPGGLGGDAWVLVRAADGVVIWIWPGE